MSAWVVSKVHIDLMVSLGLHGIRGTEVNPDNAWSFYWFHGKSSKRVEDVGADAVGEMLLSENLASVGYRYSEDPLTGDLPGPINAYWGVPYTFTDPKYQLTLAEAAHLIACYEYQSCEREEWEASEAHDYCRALKEMLLDRLPGDGGPWGWDQSDLDKAKGARFPSVRQHGWTVMIGAGMSENAPCIECGLSKTEHGYFGRGTQA
jgi:hypothetical protein